LVQRSKLIPNEKLIYERVEGVVYARYFNRPNIPRWAIGWDQTAGPAFNYSDWEDMTRLAETNSTLKKQLDKLLDLYYILRNEK
jgi:hypothetical protein